MHHSNSSAHTSKPSLKFTTSTRYFIFVALALCLAVRVAFIFTIPFTDTTEARYAEIARKMVETNDWITPQFNYGVPFWGKPPLHTWLSALGMKTMGVHEYAARLPIFAISVLMLVIVYRWLSSFRSSDFALATVFILFTNALFYLAAATVMTDLVMTLGISLSMIAFASCLFSSGRNPKISPYLFFLGLAIGLLAKGPVACVLTILPIGLWTLMHGKWKEVWQKIPWLKGSLLTVSLTLPWYILAELKTPGFIEYFIIGEHFERFIDSGWKGDLYGSGHAHAKGYIWIYALLTMLPWTPFILFSIIPRINLKKTAYHHSLFCFSCLRRRYRLAVSRRDSQDRPWLSYLICWSLAPPVFFTLATNILPTYVLPAVLPLSILALEIWIKDTSQATITKQRWFTVSASVATILPLIALISLTFKPGLLGHRTQKHLVCEISQSDSKSSNHPPLSYWQKRYYSAEFYTQGNSQIIATNEELQELFNNNQTDYLAVRNKHIKILQTQLHQYFELVAEFPHVSLYKENEPN